MLINSRLAPLIFRSKSLTFLDSRFRGNDED